MATHPDVLGAVLAGGAGERLGGSKAMAALAGRKLISYPLAALAAAGIEVVVVAKPDTALPDGLGARVVREAAEPRHPLLGVVTALRHASGRSVLACACDMPFVTPGLLARLAASSTTTAGVGGGHLQPLLALYQPDVLPALEAAVAAGESATGALSGLHPQTIEISEREAFNVNTTDDLAYAASIATRAL